MAIAQDSSAIARATAHGQRLRASSRQGLSRSVHHSGAGLLSRGGSRAGQALSAEGCAAPAAALMLASRALSVSLSQACGPAHPRTARRVCSEPLVRRHRASSVRRPSRLGSRAFPHRDPVASDRRTAKLSPAVHLSPGERSGTVTSLLHLHHVRDSQRHRPNAGLQRDFRRRRKERRMIRR